MNNIFRKIKQFIWLTEEEKTKHLKPVEVEGKPLTVERSNYAKALIILDEILKTVVNIDLVKDLIKHGADINAKIDGFPLITYTAKHDDVAIAKILIEAGASINAINDFGEHIIVTVLDWGGFDVAKLLLSKNINPQKDSLGFTPLMSVILPNEHKFPSKIYKLIPDIKRKKTAEHIEEAVKLLLGKFKNTINKKSNDGLTALIIAASYNRIKVMDLLVDSGADINLRDKDGYSALEHAKMEENTEAVIYLLKIGIKNPYNITKSSFGELRQGMTKFVKPEVEPEVKNASEIKPEDLEAKDWDDIEDGGSTPERPSGEEEEVGGAQEEEAPENISMEDLEFEDIPISDMSTLMRLVMGNATKEAIIAEGLRGGTYGVNYKDRGSGMTALMIAAFFGKFENIKTLVALGAKLTPVNMYGKTAYGIVQKREEMQIIKK